MSWPVIIVEKTQKGITLFDPQLGIIVDNLFYKKLTITNAKIARIDNLDIKTRYAKKYITERR